MKTTISFKPLRIFFICMAAMLFSVCSTGTADNGKGMKKLQRPGNRVEGEYLVKLRTGAAKENIEKSFQDYKIIEISLIGERLYKLKIKKDPGPEVIRKIAEDSGVVEYIEPNYIFRALPKSNKKIQ